MARPRPNPDVRDFILRNVRTYPANIAAVTAARYGLSRPAISGYLRRLVNEGLIDATGNTRDRRYTARDLVSLDFEVQLSVGLSEDAVWQGRIFPHVGNLPENIINSNCSPPSEAEPFQSPPSLSAADPQMRGDGTFCG